VKRIFSMGGANSVARRQHTRLQSRIFLRVYHHAKLRNVSVQAAVQEALLEASGGRELLTLPQFLAAARSMQLLSPRAKQGPESGSPAKGVCSEAELAPMFEAHGLVGHDTVPVTVLASALSSPSGTSPSAEVLTGGDNSAQGCAAADASVAQLSPPTAVVGAPFVDREFPVGGAALGGGSCGTTRPVWKRPSEFLRPADGAPVLFATDPSPGDVLEGALGNCFFIAAVSVLCQRPDMVRALFMPGGAENTADRSGRYAVRFFRDGKWLTVCVDDQLPCHPSQLPGSASPLLFGRTRTRRELWLPLLEKAYAKFYGGYGAINGGNCAEALRDLTGCAVEDVNLTRARDGVWSRLWRWARPEQMEGPQPAGPTVLLGCGFTAPHAKPSTAPEAEQSTAGSGILPNHAYSVTRVAEVSVVRPRQTRGSKIVAGTKCRLLQVRNPWGRFEWTGRWGAGDTASWSSVARRELRAQGIQPAAEQGRGTFWMCWDDFVAHFNRIHVCLLGTSPSAPRLLTARAQPPLPAACIFTGSAPASVVLGHWPGGTAVGVPADFVGGCMQYPGWGRNMAFELVLQGDIDALLVEHMTVVLSLSQPDVRTQRRAANLAVSYNQIGICIVTVADGAARLHADACEVVSRTSFWNKRDVAHELLLRELIAARATGRRVLVVPSTFFPGQPGSFLLTATLRGAPPGHCAPPQVHLRPRDVRGHVGEVFEAVATGRWQIQGDGDAGTAGGRASSKNPHFWQNPRHFLKLCLRPGPTVTSGCRVSVMLAQKSQPLLAAAEQVGKVAEPQHIGVYALRGTQGLKAYREAARCGERTALKSADCVGENFQFARSMEVSRVLELTEQDVTSCTSQPIVLVPCTYNARIEGEYLIHVTSSSPVDLSLDSVISSGCAANLPDTVLQTCG